MLFNSYVFIFAFLPLALLGYYAAARFGRPAAAVWLVVVSFVFYGWWNPVFVPFLVASIAFNYGVSKLIERTETRPRLQDWMLVFGIAGNIGALVYFKYLVWLAGILRGWGLAGVDVGGIVLPLGISFFTFTQLGYLVDVKQGVAKDRGLLDYVVFVTFFPHLIAGPILHNREMMPQFADAATYRFSARNLAVGLSIFVIGLLKKCLLADPISGVVAPGYAHPGGLALFSAWNVVLCYSLQLYFDFSGYSDMAIGLARMFNVRFPLNFNSPYKAASVIDYWQRWHMTLTRFLTLYLYNPIALAVTRRRAARGLGTTRRAHATAAGFASMVMFPTLATMALIGLWHGAGSQFLVFGLLHGVYLCVNHAWRIWRHKPAQAVADGWAGHAGRVLLTYLAVLVGSVFFRAPDNAAAVQMLGGMVGLHGAGPGLAVPAMLAARLGGAGGWLASHGIITAASVRDAARAGVALLWLVVLYGIVWLLPNSQQIMWRYEPALGKVQPGPWPWLSWRLTMPWAMAVGFGAAIGVLALGGTGEFLYFQF